MTDPAAKARELMAAIRYQVFRPEVTTMGRCQRCGEAARGAAMCAGCLGGVLDTVTGWPHGTDYVAACEEQRAAERVVLREAQERGEYGGRE